MPDNSTPNNFDDKGAERLPPAYHEAVAKALNAEGTAANQESVAAEAWRIADRWWNEAKRQWDIAALIANRNNIPPTATENELLDEEVESTTVQPRSLVGSIGVFILNLPGLLLRRNSKTLR